MGKIKQSLLRLKSKTEYTLSTVVVKTTPIGARRNKILKELKNKYNGQRCFIIGNGPSLTVSDLESLKDEVTFASNRIFKIFDETDWRPDYYGVFDESVFCSDEIIEKINAFDCKAKFFREQGWSVSRKIKNSCYIHTWYSRKYLDEPEFSEDVSKGIYTIATVTYSLIQIAKYMGFTEIYLIGVDNKYASEKKKDGSVVNNRMKSYFGKDYANESTVVASTWEMDEVYKFVEKYSRENGFRIFNATRGGYLETFERVSLDDILMS